MSFSIDLSYNRYLAPGQERVEAIVTVTAPAALVTASDQHVLGFIIDCSKSMGRGRLDAVKAALHRTMTLIDDETIIFVVAFNHQAALVVEPQLANAAVKQAALATIEQLVAGGGTALSRGLELAWRIFADYPGAIRQAIFLTDGKNESEPASALERLLTDCAGSFQCTCWGVGTNWRVAELQRVAQALLGQAKLIPGPAEIADAFVDEVMAARRKELADLRLRLWLPATAQAMLTQVYPRIIDLTEHTQVISDQVIEVQTGAWGPGEQREYHLSISLTPAEVGAELRAGRVSLVAVRPDQVHEEQAPARPLVVSWTPVITLWTPVDARVAHYTGQQELALAIQAGLAAQERGETGEATRLLGRAVQLAHESADGAMTTRLKRVVEVLDEASGTVRLRRRADKEATMVLALESTTTRRATRGPAPANALAATAESSALAATPEAVAAASSSASLKNPTSATTH